MEQFKKWFTPERAIGIQGIGLGLSQMAAGQAPNLSPAYQALEERKEAARLKGTLENSGLMEKFTPDQRAILAQMPPAAAQRIIAQQVFARPEAPKVTDDMAEYNFAVSQGYQGTLQDFMLEGRRAGATVVNVGQNGVDYGTPPTDMAWRRDENGKVMVDERGAPMAVYVQGSPGDQKRVADIIETSNAAIDRAEQDAADPQGTAGDVVMTAAERALAADAERVLTGVLGAVASYNPSSNNAEVYRQVGVLQSVASAEALNAMRRQSETGGALGNVTEKELKLLSEQAGTLDPRSPNFERDLKDYTRNILRTIHGKEAGDAIFEKGLSSSSSMDFSSDSPPAGLSADDAELWGFASEQERKLIWGSK